MNPAKTYSVGRDQKWNPSNPILSEFRDRIIQYLPKGLNKIWFQLNGDTEFELAGALSFMPKDYDKILRFGGFTTADFKIQVQKLQNMIGVEIEVSTYQNHDGEDGKVVRETWIRFKNDIFADRSSRLALRAEEEASRPYDFSQDEYISVFHSQRPVRTR